MPSSSSDMPTIPPGGSPLRGELYDALLESAERGVPFPVRDIETLAGLLRGADEQGVHARSDAFASDDVLNAYTSLTRSVEHVYCKEILLNAAGWLRHLKELLDDPRMGFAVASSLLATFKSNVDDIKRDIFGNFRRKTGRVVDDEYTLPLEAIRDIHAGVAEAVGGGSRELSDRWRKPLHEMEGLIRDAGKILQAVEIKFIYLRALKDAPSLSGALSMLVPDGYDRIDTIVSSLRKLHLPRAEAYAIWMNIGWIPSLFVPESLRADLVRIMNELILNAIKFRDLNFRTNRKMERDIHLMAASDGPKVSLAVMDNGRGEAELRRQLREGSGLTVASELAMRNGWRLFVESDRDRGASASLELETSAWGSSLSSVPPGRSTLPAPGGLRGADAAEMDPQAGRATMALSAANAARQVQQVQQVQPVQQIFRGSVFPSPGATPLPYQVLPGPGFRR